MIARKYTKRIELWQTSIIADGYGGNTVSTTLISKSWANVKTASNNSRYASRMVELGVTDPINAIIIQLRQRNDITYNAINQFIMYQGVKYIIQNAPTNIDFNGTDIEIIATREATASVYEITPIGTFVFDDTFDLTFN